MQYNVIFQIYKISLFSYQLQLPLADFIRYLTAMPVSRWWGFQLLAGSGLPQNCLLFEFLDAKYPLRPQPLVQVFIGHSAPCPRCTVPKPCASPGTLCPISIHMLLSSMASLGCPSSIVLCSAPWLISPLGSLPGLVHFCLLFSCSQPGLLSIPGRQKAHNVGVSLDLCSPDSTQPSLLQCSQGPFQPFCDSFLIYDPVPPTSSSTVQLASFAQKRNSLTDRNCFFSCHHTWELACITVHGSLLLPVKVEGAASSLCPTFNPHFPCLLNHPFFHFGILDLSLPWISSHEVFPIYANKPSLESSSLPLPASTFSFPLQTDFLEELSPWYSLVLTATWSPLKPPLHRLSLVKSPSTFLS